jgi:hypothetical protein
MVYLQLSRQDSLVRQFGFLRFSRYIRAGVQPSRCKKRVKELLYLGANALQRARLRGKPPESVAPCYNALQSSKPWGARNATK